MEVFGVDAHRPSSICSALPPDASDSGHLGGPACRGLRIFIPAGLGREHDCGTARPRFGWGWRGQHLPRQRRSRGITSRGCGWVHGASSARGVDPRIGCPGLRRSTRDGRPADGLGIGARERASTAEADSRRSAEKDEAILRNAQRPSGNLGTHSTSSAASPSSSIPWRCRVEDVRGLPANGTTSGTVRVSRPGGCMVPGCTFVEEAIGNGWETSIYQPAATTPSGLRRHRRTPLHRASTRSAQLRRPRQRQGRP